MIRWKINHINQGLHLRSLGLSYGSIAIVMAEYHGLVGITETAVRSQLRTHGAAPFPRGRQEQLRPGKAGHRGAA